MDSCSVFSASKEERHLRRERPFGVRDSKDRTADVGRMQGTHA